MPTYAALPLFFRSVMPIAQFDWMLFFLVVLTVVTSVGLLWFRPKSPSNLSS